MVSTARACFPVHWSHIHNIGNGSVARIIVAWDPHSLKVVVIFCSDQLILARVETSDHRTFHISVVYGQNHMVGRRSL